MSAMATANVTIRWVSAIARAASLVQSATNAGAQITVLIMVPAIMQLGNAHVTSVGMSQPTLLAL